MEQNLANWIQVHVCSTVRDDDVKLLINFHNGGGKKMTQAITPPSSFRSTHAGLYLSETGGNKF